MRSIHDRRTFAVLAAACAGLLLAGCAAGGGAPKPTPTSAQTASWSTTTAKASGDVDRVTWALPYGEPTTLHWLRAAAFSENTVLSSLCEGLLKTTPDLGIAPALAESWKTPDDRTYVYQLRKGVTFTDGTPMTADDVAYSLNQNLDPQAGSFWSGWFTRVQSIKATGPLVVTVRLKEPDVLFNQIMSTAAGTVVERKFAESAGATYGTPKGGVMCTGPYSLSSWTAGSGIEVTANPHYWDTDNRPRTRTIDYRFVTNATTLTNGLRSGDLDGAFDLNASTVQSLRSADDGQVVLGRGTGFVTIETTTKQGPARDVNVRRALSLALDRDAIASSIFHSAAAPIRSPYFPSTWGYAHDIYQAGYDALPAPTQNLEEAKRLVSQATDATGTMRLLTNADDPTSQQLAAYIQGQAQAIGLKVELAALPSTQYIATAFDAKQRNSYDLTLSTTSYTDIAEPVYWSATTLAKDGPFNSFGYDDPDVQAWIDEARRTEDPAARAALMVRVMDRAYGRDLVSISLVNLAGTLFLNNRLTGVPATFNAHLYGPWAAALGAAT